MRVITVISRYFKLVILSAFYSYLIQDCHYIPQIQALLYHQFQTVPLLSRVNRQPQAQLSSPQSYGYNENSDNLYNSSSFTTNLEQNYYVNKNNQHQPTTDNRQQQNSYLTSTTVKDTNNQLNQQQQPHHQHRLYNQLQQHNDAIIATDNPGSLTDSFGCPVECHCNKIAQIADCSNRNLSHVPTSFPKEIKRIRLERNNIKEIGPYAFQGLKRLQRIDLSNNNLLRIDALAFYGGLQSLNSLILYSNKLEELPENLFIELGQLQLLLLNANSLRTIHRDLFQSLANLNLLSLYDNNIETLQSGTFDGLKSIKTIHLGKNPLNCDCNLRWLANYLELNPNVETSEARCEAPKNARVQGKKLSHLSKTEFKCSESLLQPSSQQTGNKGPQQQQAQIDPSGCPIGCICSGSTVDCSRTSSATSQEHRANGDSQSNGGIYELPDIPDDVPVYVARVHINDQRIKRIRQTGLFRRLANSQKLDLGNNKIVDIEDNAINGQFSNGQKPERVVFVLLENQHCGPAAAGSTVDGPPIPIDPCSSAPKVNDPQFDSPCYNGGSCKSNVGTNAGLNSTASLNYVCICPPGFAGPLCEINIDDCVDHQCQNGAMCVDGVNSYKCMCRDPTTSGEFCEQLATSSSAPSPSLSFPYATSSAVALSTFPLVAPPLALPIISSGSGPGGSNSANELVANHHQPPPGGGGGGGGQQILARSADFSRSSSGSMVQQELQQQQQQVSTPTSEVDQFENRPVGSGCQRLTQRKYFDDGNGCQSVRLLKLSTCVGSCGTNGECCQPARVKRRRVRMQCSDGASYVKSIDLIKKCSCSSECPASSASNFPFAATSSPNETNDALMGETRKSSQYFKYLTSSAATAGASQLMANNHKYNHHSSSSLSGPSSSSQDDQIMQITRLDAVD